MSIEKLDGSKVKISLEVSAAKFSEALDQAFEKVSEKVEIKGFRKGKVPRDAFEKKFGVEALFDEALSIAVPPVYTEYIVKEKVDVIAQPNFDIDMPNIKVGKPVKFAAIVAVKPEVTLGNYKGVEITKINTEVTEDEIDLQVTNLRGKDSMYQVAEKAIEKGDQVIFDFTGKMDGEEFEGGKAENHTLVIGSGQFIPGFEDQMVGLKATDEKDLEVTFPENYQAEHLAGKPAIFTVKIHEVKTRELKEMDEEFFKTLNKDGVTDEASLREDIKTRAVEYKENQAESNLIDQAVDIVSNEAKVDIPQVMIDNEYRKLEQNVANQAKQYNMSIEMFVSMSGGNYEKFKEDLATNAEKRVRYNLVLEEVIKQEKIEADDASIEDKYKELAAQTKVSVEQVKTMVQPDMITMDVQFDKAAKFLVEKANVK